MPEPQVTQPAAPATPTAATGAPEGEVEGLRQASKAERAKRKAAEEQLAALQKQLEEHTTAAQRAKDKELADNNQHKTLYDALKLEHDKLKEERKMDLARMTRMQVKFRAAEKLPGVKDQYLEAFFPFDKVKLDADGNPTGLDEAVKEFTEAYPDLVSKAEPPKGPQSPRGFLPQGGNPGAQSPPTAEKGVAAAKVALEKAFSSAGFGSR